MTPDKTVQVDDRLVPEQAAWRWETNPEGRRYLNQIHGAGDEAGDNTGVYVVPPSERAKIDALAKRFGIIEEEREAA